MTAQRNVTEAEDKIRRLEVELEMRRGLIAIQQPEKSWQKRLIEELDELSKRIVKLDDFRRGREWDKLDDTDQGLLNEQCIAMCRYSTALCKRIARLKQGDANNG